MLQKINENKNTLFGCSDASFKEGRGAHAWILSSGQVSDIEDPDLHITGGGPVDGHSPYSSSSRSELHRATALSIMAKLFPQLHSSMTIVQATCDNQGVIQRCSNPMNYNLRKHREANTDLYLTQQITAAFLLIQYNWVKGQTDKSPWRSISDLSEQKLGRGEIYNVWCHHLASEAGKFGSHPVNDPGVSPAERWALYSKYPYYHKITEELSDGIHSTLGYNKLLDNITKKHGIRNSHLYRVNFFALKRYIDGLKVYKRPSTVKLINGWNPTYGHLSRQGREQAPLCPRCPSTIETHAHCLVCQEESATNKRLQLLYSFLLNLEQCHTVTCIFLH
jgi:predicted nucleic acid-binding Zn ribbon protein